MKHEDERKPDNAEKTVRDIRQALGREPPAQKYASLQMGSSINEALEIRDNHVGPARDPEVDLLSLVRPLQPRRRRRT